MGAAGYHYRGRNMVTGSRRLRSSLLGFGLLAFGLAVGPAVWSSRAGARNPCEEQGNLTQNCGFDTFVDDWQGAKRYQIPTGWWYFILAGDLDYRPSDDTYWGAPSLWMLSDGVPFTAGIYQEVSVTPGVVYQADAGWAAVSRPDFERKMGLDPTGGTDPLASTVIWGPSEWGISRWPDLTVSARATGPRMTVFVWVHHPKTYGNDWFFLDAVGLWPDPNQPVATSTPSETPTSRPPTSRPPTQTPLPATPTDTATALPPSPMPTETSTPPPTATPTQTPTFTPTPTWTSTPTPAPSTATPFPTRTPLPTIVPVAMSVPTVEAGRSIGGESAGTGGSTSGTLFLYIALGALLASLVLAGIVRWLRKNARQAAVGE